MGAGEAGDLPGEKKEAVAFTTKPNEWTKYGMRYLRQARCPLVDNEVDRRFFNPDGSPNAELLRRANMVKQASREILGDPEPAVYVVKGVGSRSDKTAYNGDIDFCVCTTTPVPLDARVGEVRQTIDEKTKNLAYQIALKVNNGHLPEHWRDFNSTDIMVSPYLPYEYSPMEPGESEIFFDIDNKSWFVVTPNI